MRLESKDRGVKVDEETRDRILQTIEKLDKVSHTYIRP
jgi:DNA-binding LacI/PurR family transcriptional regulator